jgi:hypothetical protein
VQFSASKVDGGPFASPPRPQPAPTESPAFPVLSAEPGLAEIAIPTTPAGGVNRLRGNRRRNAKRRNLGLVVGSLAVIAVVGVIFAVQSMRQEPAAPQAAANPPQPSPLVEIPQQTELEEKQANVAIAESASPTQGEPITLQFVPAGARIIVNLRPAELWQAGALGEEFRYCLGPLGEWTEAKIKELCLYEPAQIEEALICLILGPKGVPPQTAVVVRLVAEEKKSALVQKFAGQPDDQFGYPVYMADERAFLIHDLKTFAAVPKNLASEMVDALAQGGPTADGIQQLLPETDRRRHVTLIFEPADARLHQDVLVPPLVAPLLNRALDWLNEDDVETVAWCLHLSDPFYSEVLLRNRQVIRPPQLERDLRKKLNALPEDLHLVLEQYMHPAKMKSGHRKIIGRFPAMLKAFSAATLTGVADRHVQLATMLPERAAPNLALGALLTWDESTRTDFTKSAPSQTAAPAKPKEKIAERLKKVIDIDFRRTPLQEAFAYIAEETKVPIDIDGDALKLSGYTKNMPQTFNLGMVPATQAIAAIFKQYDQMVIVVDEPANLATVMTKAVAEQKGLKPFPLGP